MENHTHSSKQEDGTRRPTTRTHTIITRAAIVSFSFVFISRGRAVTKHNMLLTSLLFVELVVELYTLQGGASPRNFQFSGAGIVAALQPVR